MSIVRPDPDPDPIDCSYLLIYGSVVCHPAKSDGRPQCTNGSKILTGTAENMIRIAMMKIILAKCV